MARFNPPNRRSALGAAAASLLFLAAGFVGIGSGGSSSSRELKSVDTGLCPFPLDVTVTSKNGQAGATALGFTFTGPSTITLRNASTGSTAVLDSSGSYSANPVTGTVTFRGRHVWFWAAGNHVPFLTTDGAGSLKAPYFVLAGATSHARVVDPCALVAPSPPSTRPLTTPAPWGLPVYALSQIGYAGLTPLRGTLYRHDHVHLDLFVNGKKVTVPAGIGLAEPVDNGPCPNTGLGTQGDCATRHIFTAQVANSPIHTHSTSGIIHIEPDRPGVFTLGQFFDEWGVRLNSGCLGSYCAGGGKQLRVYVNGKRSSGNPRSIVLTNHQEIAVAFGGPGDFGSVPTSYTGGWPGLGCGGAGEASCFPPGADAKRAG
ncbi:MAG TPA: hypothetical protein VMV08_03090 [Gaiellaceae bacterium]|nr:hypothetical protein [Gaiellaceae bacterium]